MTSAIDNRLVLSAIGQINAAREQAAVVDALTAFVAHYGFERIYLGQLVNPLNVPLDRVLYISNWPEELRKRREASLAILHDPIARCALRSKRPFKWSEAYRHAGRLGRRIVDEARDYRIADGYMFPMHALDSVSGGVSLGAERLDLSPLEVTQVEIVAQHAYYRLEAMLGPFPYQFVAELSPRETEIVQFAAAGKTNWEIATILAISEDAVKEAMKRASRKLKASNRAHAVANAIAQNLIFP